MTSRGRVLVVAVLSLALGVTEAAAQGNKLTRTQVEQGLAGSRQFFRKDLSRLDLAGLDLSRADLTHADLSGTSLAGANLTEAVLESANLLGADLSMAVLARAKLAGANLRRVKGGGADFSGADLGKVETVGADLRGANLRGARLVEAQLIVTDLRGASLAGADLERATLRGSNLAGASLAQANLRQARVAEADFRDADLAGANLFDVDVSSAPSLSKAKGFGETVRQDAPAAAPVAKAQPAPLPEPSAAWTVRIHFKYGAPVEADAWRQEGDMLFYSRGGAELGVPYRDVARIEDREGKVLRESSTLVFVCRTPEVGEPEIAVLNYFKCAEQRPSYRTVSRQGRQYTRYWLWSRRGYASYFVYNGVIREIVVGGQSD